MTDADRFPVPAARVSAELEIKRSRFIATVDFVADRAAFEQLLSAQRERFPDAGHHCWAYLAGAPGDLRCADKSDDGEPRGTAGRPLLNVLEHSGLGFVGAVVSRYFGGIKLGAGGLVRAYTHSIGAALELLDTRTHFITETHDLQVPYTRLASVEHWLATTDIEVAGKQFADEVTLRLQVPVSKVEEARATLAALIQRDIVWQRDRDT